VRVNIGLWVGKDGVEGIEIITVVGLQTWGKKGKRPVERKANGQDVWVASRSF